MVVYLGEDDKKYSFVTEEQKYVFKLEKGDPWPMKMRVCKAMQLVFFVY